MKLLPSVKLLLAALTAALCLAWLTPEEATAQERGYRAKPAKKYYRSRDYRAYRRPPSVGPNGLCQRDTGTPTGELNFRNKCDTEEFWRRQIERGNGRF